MTQIPPPPPGQFRAPSQMYAPPPPRKTSAAAIASLVCGLVGCVPLLTSLAAVVLGIVGIRATSDPQKSGRGFAIAGLVLGIIGLLGWGLMGIPAYLAYKEFTPAKVAATTYITNLANGDVAAARTQSDTTVTDPELAILVSKMQAWGKLNHVSITGFNFVADTRGTIYDLSGTANFANGSKAFEIKLVKNGSTYLVRTLVFK